MDGKKPVLNLHSRREFLSIFTCLLIQASLSTLTLERDGRAYHLQWNGFPDDYFRDQFFTYQWIESMKVAPEAAKAAKEGYIRILAQLSLGCAMALVPCVIETPPNNVEASVPAPLK